MTALLEPNAVSFLEAVKRVSGAPDPDIILLASTDGSERAFSVDATALAKRSAAAFDSAD